MNTQLDYVLRTTTFTVAILSLTPVLAAAQTPADHLQCHKVTDSSKFKFADVTLIALETSFQVPAGCTVKGKAKEICIPTSKAVIETDAPVPPFVPVVDPAAASYVCYKLKCPKQEVVDTLVTDQFGVRDLQKIKKAGKLCVPIAHGVVTTTTTTTMPAVCTEDVKVCSDGSVVQRDPANNCEFERCPGDCDVDADCRVYSSFCTETACQCLATGQTDPDPVCENGTVICLVDPCLAIPSTPVCSGGVCTAVPD
jgi:hypothetical protein